MGESYAGICSCTESSTILHSAQSFAKPVLLRLGQVVPSNCYQHGGLVSYYRRAFRNLLVSYRGEREVGKEMLIHAEQGDWYVFTYKNDKMEPTICSVTIQNIHWFQELNDCRTTFRPKLPVVNETHALCTAVPLEIEECDKRLQERCSQDLILQYCK